MKIRAQNAAFQINSQGQVSKAIQSHNEIIKDAGLCAKASVENSKVSSEVETIGL